MGTAGRDGFLAGLEGGSSGAFWTTHLLRGRFRVGSVQYAATGAVNGAVTGAVTGAGVVLLAATTGFEYTSALMVSDSEAAWQI